METSHAETCRICWETCDCSELLAPCECAGTMKFVHASCLQEWVTVKNSNVCDICAAQMPVQVVQARRHHEVNKLPLNLKCAIATMWVYTGLVILLPLFIHHWEGKAL